MAEVYVARSRGVSGFEKRVAIKRILPHHADNERFIKSLVDEAKIAVSLTHPNIAQVYELAMDGDDNYFMVMEYIEGRPLSGVLDAAAGAGSASLPIPHAAQIMSDVAKGLDHAHKKTDPRGVGLSIVHRDVSPQNVLISYQGDAKLIDFGIARAHNRLAQTCHGVIKGKLRYLAPEIAMGEAVDHRADIYCAGLVLFELLTGEPMFHPRDDFDAVQQAREANVRSPRSINPNVPETLDQIVMRACAKDRAQRYASAKDLHIDLRVFLNQRHPTFIGSEIAEYMEHLFAEDIARERRLDSLAESLAREGLTLATPASDAPTVSTSSFPKPKRSRKESSRSSGRELPRPTSSPDSEAPRLRLADADGGNPMSLVLAGAGAGREPIERSSYTQAPRVARVDSSDQSQLTRLEQGHKEKDDPIEDDEFEIVEDSRAHVAEISRTLDEGSESERRLPGFVADTNVPPPPLQAEPTTAMAPTRADPRGVVPARVTAAQGTTPRWMYFVLALVLITIAVLAVAIDIAIAKRREEPAAPPTSQTAPAAPVESIPPVEIEATPPAGGPVELAFKPETPPKPEAPAQTGAVGHAGVASAKAHSPRSDGELDGSGQIQFKTFPASAVYIDGRARGRAPLTLSVKAGMHDIVLRGPNGEVRKMARFIGRGKNAPVIVYW
jgi:serine/threonine protein kinase